MFLVPSKDRTTRSDKRRTLKERRFRAETRSRKCIACALYLRLESGIDQRVARLAASICTQNFSIRISPRGNAVGNVAERGELARKMLSMCFKLGNYGIMLRGCQAESCVVICKSIDRLNIYNAIIS